MFYAKINWLSTVPYEGEYLAVKSDYAGHEKKYQQRKQDGAIGWDDCEVYETFQNLVDQTLKAVDAPTMGMLLELGCGAGNMTCWFAKKGYKTTGIDIAPSAIAWAKERARSQQMQMDFRTGNALELPRDFDNAFDIVFDGHCLHCIIGEDRNIFLRNAYRALKPGGCFLVYTMCGEVLDPDMQPYFDVQSRHVISGNIAIRHIGYPEAILEEIRHAGFSITYAEVARKNTVKEMDELCVAAKKPE